MANYSSSKGGRDEPFDLHVARGDVYKHSHIFKYGYNAAVGTGGETIWIQGGDYTWQAAAAIVKVSSSAAADDAASTGARTVTLEGLDANYAEISETVTMDGTTTVDTTNSFLRLHRMYVATAGTGLTNAGVIYAAVTGDTYGTPGVPDTQTKIMSTIGATEGQTLQAFYTVPAGKTAYISNISAGSADGTNSSTIDFRTRLEGGAFRTKDKFVVFKSTDTIPHSIPLKVVEKTDIEVRGTSALSTTDVNASFDILLVTD